MRVLLSVLAICLSLVCWAEDVDVSKGEWPSEQPAAPTTELALELVVTIDPAVKVGDSDLGHRQFIPITGGYFRGKNGMKGTVNAGGADWQLKRIDGVLIIEAIYSITTDDGATIEIHNTGISNRTNGEQYTITNPVFHAPQGKYDWMNKHFFVGTITPAYNKGVFQAVVIRAYQVN
jgi:hypothetical protein